MNAPAKIFHPGTRPDSACGHLVVRILSGRLTGKAFALDGRERLCIGHALANDVVLRGAGTRECAAQLVLEGRAARISVTSGTIELLGRALEAGEAAALPPYLPFGIGEFLVAYGEASSPRWDDAQALAEQQPLVPAPAARPPSLVDRLGRMLRDRASGLDQRVVKGALAAGSIALIAIAVAQPARDVIAARAADTRILQQALHRAGFDSLLVAKAEDGTVQVNGVVRDEAELSRLRALVMQRNADILVDVQTGAALEQAAADILQAQGIAARVKQGAPGSLAIYAGYMPADRRRQAGNLLRRDLPAIRRITFHVDDGMDASPLQAFFTQSGTGLATVVDSPAHIVTADGSRWFPGATLPTGHHLISVSAQSVIFEKDGRTEKIRL